MSILESMELNNHTVAVKVNKIYSYQTLVYKNGNRTFRKKVYNDYIHEISHQIEPLTSFYGEVDITINFLCKSRTVGDIDNITKPILDTLQMAGKIENDRLITKMTIIKSFGHTNNEIIITVKHAENENYSPVKHAENENYSPVKHATSAENAPHNRRK